MKSGLGTRTCTGVRRYIKAHYERELYKDMDRRAAGCFRTSLIWRTPILQRVDRFLAVGTRQKHHASQSWAVPLRDAICQGKHTSNLDESTKALDRTAQAYRYRLTEQHRLTIIGQSLTPSERLHHNRSERRASTVHYGSCGAPSASTQGSRRSISPSRLRGVACRTLLSFCVTEGSAVHNTTAASSPGFAGPSLYRSDAPQHAFTLKFHFR